MVEETGLPFVVKFAGRREFYLQMHIKPDAPMPEQFETSCFINVMRKGSVINCSTRNLVRYFPAVFYGLPIELMGPRVYLGHQAGKSLSQLSYKLFFFLVCR